MKKIIIGLIVVVVLGALYVYSTYNSLVTLNVNADAQWQQVEADYQRRFDLIPGLVESVKGTLEQEQEVFGAIAEARTQYNGATTPEARAEAANQVESALGRLLVIVENYPELKSSDVMKGFMSQLEGTENRINVQRMRYNDTVKAYNLKVMRVPSSIVAGMFGFDERVYFEATEGAEIAPTFDF